MTRNRSIIGALALCALAFCAFGAANASAVIEKGLTAVKCVNVGEGGKYNNSHCSTPQSPGNFETVPIESTEIEGTSTNAEGGPEASKLTATIGGLNTIVECPVVHTVKGKVVNTVAKEGEKERHAFHGTETELTYTECRAHLASKPSRTCEIEDLVKSPSTPNTVTTNLLTSTSTGVEHQVKFSPETPGAPFTKFKILTTGTECFFKTAVTVEVTGSVEGEANTTTHSHLTFTEANNGSALKANGATAHYTGTNGTWMKGEPEITVGAETFT
jgi:hypothetical protein